MPPEEPQQSAACLRRRVNHLKLDRRGRPVPFIRNYPLQYVLAGITFVVIGILILPVTRTGIVLILFGLVGFGFAALYYHLWPGGSV